MNKLKRKPDRCRHDQIVNRVFAKQFFPATNASWPKYFRRFARWLFLYITLNINHNNIKLHQKLLATLKKYRGRQFELYLVQWWEKFCTFTLFAAQCNHF